MACALALSAAPAFASAKILTSLGTTLSPERSRASWLVAPELETSLGQSGRARLATSLFRPLDPHDNFKVPKLQLAYLHQLLAGAEALEASVALTGIDLHRWGTDGAMARVSSALEGTLSLGSQIFAALQLAVFGQLNAYAQSAAGRDLPRWGLAQKLTLSWSRGRLTAEASLLTTERQHVAWKNEIGTYEELRYEVTNGLALGISHELLTEVIDPTTGLAHGVRLFDARESRLSVLARIEL